MAEIISADGEIAAGYGVVDTRGGGGEHGQLYRPGDMGMVAHRGILHPDEYVDEALLTLMVTKRLGLTLDTVAALYPKGGRLSTTQRQKRADIDAQLLALSRAGGNMTVVARALALSEKTVDRALARARKTELQEIADHVAGMVDPHDVRAVTVRTTFDGEELGRLRVEIPEPEESQR